MSKKIIFKKASGINFMSIGAVPVTFNFSEQGLTRITGVNIDNPGRTNAIGKSTMMDMLSYGLFGEPARTDIPTQDKLVNFKNKKGCKVVVEFDIDDSTGVINSYRIERGLKPSFLRLYENDTDKTLDTIKNTDAAIREVLSSNAAVFHNCSILSINSATPFMRKTAAERREFIEGIFGLQVFRTLAKTNTEDIRVQKSKIDIASSAITTLSSSIAMMEKKRLQISDENDAKQKKIERIKDEYEKAKDAIALHNKNLESERQGVVKYYDSRRVYVRQKNEEVLTQKKAIAEKLATDVAEAEEKNAKAILENDIEVAELSAVLVELQNATPPLKAAAETATADIEDLNTSIRGLEKEIKELERSEESKKNLISSNEKTISSCNKSLLKYNTSDKCPTCGAAMSEHSKEQIAAEKAEYEKEIATLTEENAKLTAELPSIAKKIERKEALVKAARQEVEALGEAKSKLAAHEAKIKLQESEIAKKRLVSLINVDKIKADAAAADKKLVLEDENALIIEMQNELKRGIYTEKTTAQIDSKYVLDLESVGPLQDTTNISDMIKESMEEKDNKSKELAAEKYHFDVLNLVKFILSDEGAKAFFIRKILDNLNERIRVYLRKLGTRVTCKLDDSLSETITDKNGAESSYGNLSGAEKKSIDLACMLAFYHIKAIYGNVSYDSLFFDEIFDTSFDALGVTLVMTLIKEEVEKNGLKCFIISHNPLLVPHFDRTIELKMENGFTELV